MPWRSVAAAANGPITALISVSAHRIVNGVANGTGPPTAALVAATPKISTGTVIGSTITGISSPPRRSATASAAPMTPMKVSAGVPTSRVSAVDAERRRFQVQEQAENGRGDDQRQAGRDPVGQGLGQDHDFQRDAPHQDQVEGAVVMVAGEQPVEGEQRRQQRAQPQDGGPDAAQQREVGPDGERHQGHHGQEKQHPDHGAAADANGDPGVAREQGRNGRQGRCHGLADLRSEPQFLRAVEARAARGWRRG